jgi:hypothetical protein
LAYSKKQIEGVRLDHYLYISAYNSLWLTTNTWRMNIISVLAFSLITDFRLILINILITFAGKFYLKHSTYYTNSSMHTNKKKQLCPPKMKCGKDRVHLITNDIAKFQNFIFCWHISRKEQKCVHTLRILHLTTLWLPMFQMCLL